MANGLLQMIARPEIANIPSQFQAGRQSALQTRLIESQLAQQERGEQQRQILGQAVGTPQFQSQLQRFAVEQPQAAATIQDVFAGISEQNLREAFSNISLASVSPVQDQNIRLEAAKESFEGRPEFQRALEMAQEATPEDRADLLEGFVQVGQQLGVLGATRITDPGLKPTGDLAAFQIIHGRTPASAQELAEFKRTISVEKQEPEKRFENAKKLRDEFRALSRDFIKVRDAKGRVDAAGKDPSAAGDLALIFNYMKILDPGSVVRESEFATAANAGGVDERIRSLWNRLLEGERLSENQRADFLDRSDKLFESQLTLQKRNRANFTKLSKRFGIDPRDVLIEFAGEQELAGEQGGLPEGIPQGSTPAGQSIRGNPTFRTPDGRLLEVQ